MKNGKFIVFDGLDGSGKGSQMHRLAKYLFRSSKNNHLFLTREPYTSIHTEKIRQLLKDNVDPKAYAQEFTDLFVADRIEHAVVMEKILAEGVHVLCDRYKYSTLAYQATQGMAVEKLIKLHVNLPVPDLAIFLDVPGEGAAQRISSDGERPHKEVFEQVDFLRELRNNYLRLPMLLPEEHIVVIDATKPIEDVFEQVKREVEAVLTA